MIIILINLNFIIYLNIYHQIATIKFNQLHVVWGMVKDKDISQILNLLPRDAKYYFCAAKIPRAMSASTLSEMACLHGLKGIVEEDVNKAFQLARKSAGPSDFIFIGGSTFVVAEIDEL